MFWRNKPYPSTAQYTEGSDLSTNFSFGEYNVHNFSSPLKDVHPNIKEICYFSVLVSSVQEKKFTLQANVFYHAFLLFNYS